MTCVRAALSIRVRTALSTLADVATIMALATVGCGSRSTLDQDSPPIATPDGCFYDSDCSQAADRCVFFACRDRSCVAVAVRDCGDEDACTNDECVPSTGECKHTPNTPDLDGDGFRAPLPGIKAGDPGSCGNDCNDANASSHPGAREVCDGVDNDCNGIIDDSTTVTPMGNEVRISSDSEEVTPKGLGFSSTSGTYLATYSAQFDGVDAYYTVELSPSGEPIRRPTRFTHMVTQSYAGPIVWTGDRFGTAWNDRRNASRGANNYEIYFNQMAADGTKLGPDLRITESLGFSVNPSLTWTGSQFIIVWQDDGPTDGITNQVLAQRVALDGKLQGNTIRLVDEGDDGQHAPVITAGERTVGVVWMRGRVGDRRIEFATFNEKLGLIGGPIQLTTSSDQGVLPNVAFGRLGYTVVWADPDLSREIYGAVIDEKGSILIAPKPLTETPRHSRYPAVLSYGDRVLLTWSDDKAETASSKGYEIYAKVLSADLKPLTGEMRVTHADGDSVGAIPRFGPNGDVGLVFRDDRDGSAQTYFARLACSPWL